jgi:hypothetical protein
MNERVFRQIDEMNDRIDFLNGMLDNTVNPSEIKKIEKAKKKLIKQKQKLYSKIKKGDE